MEDKKVATWLHAKFLDWERAQGQRGTIREFAEWLGISEKTLGNWMNGVRLPSGDGVDRIAAKLGPEIYDLLGLQRPDPFLILIAKMIDSLPPDRREKFKERIQREYAEMAGERDLVVAK